MAEEQWTKVACVDDLEDGVPISVKLEKTTVLVVQMDGVIHACGGKCSHYGAPLAEGLLVEHTITCPWHGARFDVRTGEMESPPALAGVGCYAVKVEGGDVFLGPKKRADAPEFAAGDERTFVIVGGGAAGNAAAITLRSEGFGGRVVMVTPEPTGPYDRPSLTKEFLSGEGKAEWLPLHSEKFYANRQIEVLTGKRVVSLDPAGRTVRLDDGTSLAFDAALLATGAVPRRLRVPGADLEGVFVLRSLADAEALVSSVADAGRALVIGSGFIGMEAAASLRERGLDVIVVSPDSVPMAQVFGERIGNWLKSIHEEHGVQFRLGSGVEAIRGDGRVGSVLLSDGAEVGADVVVIGIGVTPAVDFLEGSGLVEAGAVPVDCTLRTSADGVYAAGDIAVVPESRSGEPRRVEHWIVAERQGQHVARAMLGSEEPYSSVPLFWTMQFGTSVKYAGLARQPDNVVYRGEVESGRFVAGYYQGGRLRAIAGAGLNRPFFALYELMGRGEEVSPEVLADPSAEFTWLLD